MKKRIRRFLLIGGSLLLMLATALPFASAEISTTITYTLSVDNKWIRTQTAYVPGNVYLRNIKLNQPSDLFLHNGCFYIADSGNSRVIIMNPKDGSYKTVGEGILMQPTGLSVQDDGRIYVADPQAEKVFIFLADGKLEKTISRPDSYLFSERSQFKPKKLVVTSQDVLIVLGEGSHEGLMQFDEKGVFQGYYAANKRSLSLLEKIQELIFTEQQKEQLLSRTARPIENIAINERDLIYSVTQSGGYEYAWTKAEKKTDNTLKLHNMAGKNILSPNKFMTDEWNFVDVCPGLYGNVYALTQTGVVYEYDSNGELIFSFGGRAVASDRTGLFTKAAAIDIDENGFLYILDSERGYVQVYYPTEFALSTHKALYQLALRQYEESENTWKDVLKLNGMSRIAHLGYGKTLFHQKRFSEAMEEFRIANAKNYYSDAFWEIRSEWFNQNIQWFFLGIVVLIVLAKVWKHWRIKHPAVLASFTADALAEYLNSSGTKKLVKDIGYIRSMLRHPLDSLYYLHRRKRGSFISATVLYLMLLIVVLLDTLCRGFLFQSQSIDDISVPMVILLYVLTVGLWIVGNYMISTINDGEGSLLGIYITTAYALSPYLIITPVLVALSYLLSYNEAFLISLGWLFAVIWSGVLLFIGIMNLHNYNFKETVKNFILTILFIILMVVAVAIFYIMWKQVAQFIDTLWGEITYHVQT